MQDRGVGSRIGPTGLKSDGEDPLDQRVDGGGRAHSIGDGEFEKCKTPTFSLRSEERTARCSVEPGASQDVLQTGNASLHRTATSSPFPGVVGWHRFAAMQVSGR